nr:hypothetical protein [Haloquadratum walsbyi]
MLDVRPVQRGESRVEIVEDFLDSVEEMIHIDNMLMDREFDSQHVLKMLNQPGLSCVVLKRMQTSKKAQAKRLLRRDLDLYEPDGKLHFGENKYTKRR